MYVNTLWGFYELHPVIQGIILGVLFEVVVVLAHSLLKDRNRFVVPMLIVYGLNLMAMFITIPMNYHPGSFFGYVIGALEFYVAYAAVVVPCAVVLLWRDYRKDLDQLAADTRNRRASEERTPLIPEEFR